MRDSDPSPEQIKEVYARFGLAMYFCQCIERQLATLLATKYGPGVRSLTQSQYDERLRSLFKKTLGVLLKRLRQSARVSGDLEVALGKVLEHRNWLAQDTGKRGQQRDDRIRNEKSHRRKYKRLMNTSYLTRTLMEKAGLRELADKAALS